MKEHRRAWRIGLAVVMTVAGAVALPAAYATPDAEASVRQDFNGDGYEDLAVAAAFGTVDGKAEAGYVAVLYGSASGLGTRGKQVYTQASPGVPGTPETGDLFGSGLDAADLDGDGFTDLLVEARDEKWRQDGVAQRLSRTVLWGGPSGFSSGKVLRADTRSGNQRAEPVTGDFNGDGHQDLWLPGRVEFGPFGRDGSAAAVQDDEGLIEYDNDQWLTDLVAGDVDGDGFTDIVQRVMQTEPNSNEDYPAHLNYLRGSREGLRPLTALKDAQGNTFEPRGTELALGDLNGDDRADLVIGFNKLSIFYGTANGPDTTTRQVIDQDTPGVPGTQEPLDSFGSALSIGDVDGDGYGDILVGNSEEAVGGLTGAGTFAVVPGGPQGPTGAGTKVFGQNSADVPGTAEKYDAFGSAVHLVDGNGDGRAEPVVGAFGENDSAGAVWVFRATSSGVTAKGSFSFGARTLGTVAKDGKLGYVFPN